MKKIKEKIETLMTRFESEKKKELESGNIRGYSYYSGEVDLCNYLLEFLKNGDFEDDLGKELEDFYKGIEEYIDNWNTYEKVARHFAKWGKSYSVKQEKDDCVPESTNIPDYGKFADDLVDFIKNYDSDEGYDEERLHSYARRCIKDYLLDSALGISQKVWAKNGCMIIKKKEK